MMLMPCCLLTIYKKKTLDTQIPAVKIPAAQVSVTNTCGCTRVRRRDWRTPGNTVTLINGQEVGLRSHMSSKFKMAIESVLMAYTPTPTMYRGSVSQWNLTSFSCERTVPPHYRRAKLSAVHDSVVIPAPRGPILNIHTVRLQETYQG